MTEFELDIYYSVLRAGYQLIYAVENCDLSDDERDKLEAKLLKASTEACIVANKYGDFELLHDCQQIDKMMITGIYDIEEVDNYLEHINDIFNMMTKVKNKAV